MNSSISGDSATSLILRLRNSDAVAWQEFVEIYAPLIFHWCRKFRLDAADSADVMQEVFAAVNKSIGNYQKQSTGTLRGWLWTITQNKIRDLFRKQKLQVNGVGGTEARVELDQFADPFAETSHESFTSELASKQLMHRALRLIQTDFQPQTWQAFWRSTIDGVDTSTIGQELNMSPNGVRQAKSRVLRRLREQLGDL